MDGALLKRGFSQEVIDAAFEKSINTDEVARVSMKFYFTKEVELRNPDIAKVVST